MSKAADAEQRKSEAEDRIGAIREDQAKRRRQW